MPLLSHKQGQQGKVLWVAAISCASLSLSLSLFLDLAFRSGLSPISFAQPALAATPYDPATDTGASTSSTAEKPSGPSVSPGAALLPTLVPALEPTLVPTGIGGPVVAPVPAQTGLQVAPPVTPQVTPAAPQVIPQTAPARKNNRIFPGRSNSAPLSSSVNSATLKTGTDSTTLQTGTNNTTLQVGTQSTTLQTGTDSSLLRTGVERQSEPVNILFIVDGSRSMLEKLDGQIQKIDAAKKVLEQALSRIPPDVSLGLRVFGQGYVGAGSGGGGLFAGLGGLNIESECRNTALWVPIGTHNRNAIIQKVRGLQPYGMTPLAYSIAQAAFSDFKTCHGSKVIILITDGADTCNGDPCMVIKQLLPKYGIKIKVDVVGLSLHREPQARDQLRCVAETSGGKYFDAKTAADLIDSVSASVSKAIEGRVIVRPSVDSSGGSINTQTPQDMVPQIERQQLQGLPH